MATKKVIIEVDEEVYSEYLKYFATEEDAIEHLRNKNEREIKGRIEAELIGKITIEEDATELSSFASKLIATKANKITAKVE